MTEFHADENEQHYHKYSITVICAGIIHAVFMYSESVVLLSTVSCKVAFIMDSHARCFAGLLVFHDRIHSDADRWILVNDI